MARKTKVRTTIEPGVVLTIDDTELIDLDRQGLIKSRETDDDWKADDTDEAPASKADDKKKGA